ncbi:MULTISPECIES: zinc-dependent alcohol dehydrogenase [Bacteria]|uniref:zinc-dependent alcohol dehydrogenase n=1 Tax=Bacteria TaxID=2 RepID=UPI0012B167EA|nr:MULTISPECIES: alcohol dehydrogenase catalytic domain-containing protein [Bacteria]MRY42720.1 alcohol dehydrogenase catalytic domain-containing protein [Parabacteroides distasonis]MZK52056.1 alcohol dehydrogenase catalytic domain-containing protein [Clostridium beijerinckii]MZK60197.1 alcohol dehydrogenase catalytic domain-containing protein [Clostridium beijerinckii]MZK70482.1 alcohol dehydrogenase catalytic domain-containing protein [Clostridium beijerinckii]MZK75784.1 alcohol dehydrogenas
MKSIVYNGPNKIDVEDKPMPICSDNEVLIKVAYSGICGTDLNIYVGAHPRAAAPLIIGHELSGVVAEDYPSLPKGTPVTVRPLLFCGECTPCLTGNSHVCKTLKLIGIDTDGSMAEYVKVPADKIHVLPEDISLELGAFTEPLAVGVHAVKRSGFSFGNSAIVFGAGTIGLSVASSLKLLYKANTLIVETNPFRRKIAEELGFTVIDPSKDNLDAAVSNFTNGNGVDFVFDCAGHPKVAEQLVGLVKVHGTVVIVGAYKKPAALDLLGMMFKEVNVMGVRVYEPEDFDIAIKLLEEPFDFGKIITHILPVEKAQEGFDVLLSGGDAVKVMFKF